MIDNTRNIELTRIFLNLHAPRVIKARFPRHRLFLEIFIYINHVTDISRVILNTTLKFDGLNSIRFMYSHYKLFYQNLSIMYKYIYVPSCATSVPLNSEPSGNAPSLPLSQLLLPSLRIRIALTSVFTCAETGTPKCPLHLQKRNVRLMF